MGGGKREEKEEQRKEVGKKWERKSRKERKRKEEERKRKRKRKRERMTKVMNSMHLNELISQSFANLDNPVRSAFSRDFIAQTVEDCVRNFEDGDSRDISIEFLLKIFHFGIFSFLFFHSLPLSR